MKLVLIVYFIIVIGDCQGVFTNRPYNYSFYNTVSRSNSVSKADIQCNSLPRGWRRVHPTSKFVVPDKYWNEGVNGNIIQLVCQDLRLAAPEVIHEQDWRTLQEYARYFYSYVHQFRLDLANEHKIILLSNYFDTKKQRWVTRNGEEHYVIFDYSEPSDYQEECMNLQLRKVAGKLYLSANDIPCWQRLNSFIQICQYPSNSNCFQNSQEEEDARAAGSSQTLHPIGEAFSKSYYLGNKQVVTYETAKTSCSDQGKILWDIDTQRLEANEALEIYELLRPFFAGNDLYPAAPFHRSSDLSQDNAVTKLYFSEENCAAGIDSSCLQTFVRLAKHSPFFQLCYEDADKWTSQKECNNIPPGWRREHATSKFIVADKYWQGKVNGNNIRQKCNAYGFEAPELVHEHDWRTLQEIARYFYDNVHQVPLDTILVSNHFDQTKQRWVTENGEEHYVIWASTEPNSYQRENCMNLHLQKIADKLYISANDLLCGATGTNFVQVCQYPSNSICFKHSKEEEDAKACSPRTLQYIGRAFSKAWFLGNKQLTYEVAKSSCLDQGKLLWDIDTPSLEPNESLAIHGLLRPFFAGNDLYPYAPFHRYSDLSEDNAVTKQYFWEEICAQGIDKETYVSCFQIFGRLAKHSPFYQLCYEYEDEDVLQQCYNP